MNYNLGFVLVLCCVLALQIRTSEAGQISVTIKTDAYGKSQHGSLFFLSRYVKVIIGTEAFYTQSIKKSYSPITFNAQFVGTKVYTNQTTVTLETWNTFFPKINIPDCVATVNAYNVAAAGGDGVWGDDGDCMTTYTIKYTPTDGCLTNNGNCGTLYNCNSTGDFTVACSPIDNPCLDNNGDCGPYATCAYTAVGVGTCTCISGYQFASSTNQTCLPVNPCLVDNGGCGLNSVCAHTGTFLRTCSCLPNTWSISSTNCQAISNCLPGQYQSAAPTPTSDRGCALCQAGQTCAGGTAAPVDCGSADLYSGSGATSCSAVSTGYFSTPDSPSSPTATRTSQQPCTIGYACTNGIRTSCIPGQTYQNTTGAITCNACTSACPTGLTITTACSPSSNSLCSDITPPAIFLIGGNITLAALTGVYNEPGFTANDTRDGNLTPKVKSKRTLKLNAIGIYTVTYTVSDAAGNAATPKVRYINVTDTVPPVLTLIGEKTISISQGSPFVDPFAYAVDAVDGNVTNTIVATNTTSADQLQTIITYTAWDKSGNMATSTRTVIRVLNLPIITLNGPALQTLEATKVFSEFTDLGATCTSNLEGNLTSRIVSTWAPSFVNISAPDTYVVTYSATSPTNPATVAPNVSRTVLVVDTTSPSITLLGNSSIDLEYNTSFVDPLVSCTDNLDTDASLNSRVVVTGQVNTTQGVGSIVVLTYSVSDTAGNQASPVNRTVRIVDRIAPVLTLYGNRSVVVEAATSYSDSGAFAWDNYDGAFNVSTTTPLDLLPAATPTTTLLTFSAHDSSGNLATPISRTVVVVDTTAPLVVLNGNASVIVAYGSNYVDAGATATDSLDGDVVVTSNFSGPSNITSRTGTFAMTYSARDKAGNVAAPVTRTIKIVDLIPPVVKLVGESFSNPEPGTFPYTDPGAVATDAIDGDITRLMKKSLYLLPPQTVNAKFGVLPLTSGPNYSTIFLGNLTPYTISQMSARVVSGSVLLVVYTSTDSSGNVATVNRTVSFIDRLAPVLLPRPNVPLNDALSYQNPPLPYYDSGCVAADANDGDLTDQIRVSVNSSLGSTGGLSIIDSSAPLGTKYTLRMTVSDAAGNSAQPPVVRQLTVLDNVPPIIVFDYIDDVKIAVGVAINTTLLAASAIDNYDGDLTKNMTVSGSGTANVFNENGVFDLVYTVTDSSGNTATLSRTITVGTGTSAAASTADSSKTSLIAAVASAVSVAFVVGLVLLVVIVRRRNASKPSQVAPANILLGDMPLTAFGRDDSHLSVGWYHGMINRDETESRLSRAGMKNGAFLLRAKDKERGFFTLSLAFKGSAFHYLIKINADNSLLFQGVAHPTWGDSVVSMIEFLKENSVPEVECKLVYPVLCTSAPPSRRTSNHSKHSETDIDGQYVKPNGRFPRGAGEVHYEATGDYENPTGSSNNAYAQPSGVPHIYNEPLSTGVSSGYAVVHKSKPGPADVLNNGAYETPFSNNHHDQPEYALASGNSTGVYYALANHTGESSTGTLNRSASTANGEVMYDLASAAESKHATPQVEEVTYSLANHTGGKTMAPNSKLISPNSSEVYYALASPAGPTVQLGENTYALADHSGTETLKPKAHSNSSEVYYALASAPTGSTSGPHALYASNTDDVDFPTGFGHVEIDHLPTRGKDGYIQIEL